MTPEVTEVRPPAPEAPPSSEKADTVPTAAVQPRPGSVKFMIILSPVTKAAAAYLILATIEVCRVPTVKEDVKVAADANTEAPASVVYATAVDVFVPKLFKSAESA